jgi:hypothetical protein
MASNELQPPYNLASGQAWLWAKAAEIPAARLLGDGSGLPDAMLLWSLFVTSVAPPSWPRVR